MPALNPRIKVVFFDIGNVLLHFNAADILKEVAGVVGRHPLTVAKYLWHSHIGEDIELGLITGRQLFGMFQKELGYRGDYTAFRKLWCDHFRVHRGTVTILRRVSRTHRVYLLSNTNALHYDFIRKEYDFARLVRGAVLSYKLKMRKPEPRIYQAALKMARARPQESVFIDDLRENVEAAAGMGMHAIQFLSSENLRERLLELGVLRG